MRDLKEKDVNRLENLFGCDIEKAERAINTYATVKDINFFQALNRFEQINQLIQNTKDKR